MMRWAALVMVTSAAVLVGCDAFSSPSSSRSTPPAAGATTTLQATTTTPPKTENLPVTDDVRHALLTAGAALHNLPTSDFTGLVAGDTYYAYDASSSTYWAGAALAPSPTSEQAQVSSQDDGSYLLFFMSGRGVWTAYDDGLGGIGGTQCPVTIPPDVLAAWGWAPGTCLPPHR